jgi:hypothetical protein
MYQALLWGRYSGQTDQRLERDIKHASTVIDPVDALLNEIIDVRGRLDVRAADLEGRGIDHPIFRIMHVVAKSRGAADWFTGIPLAGNSSLARGENYYIFPSSVLYKSGQYTNDNHIHKKMINEIANRVILTRWKNSEESPDKILAEVNARFPDALAQQFVPTDPSLWTIDKFENFLQLRREMIAQAINNYLASLTEARIPEHVFPQIAKISDPAVAVEARRGVEKLTVEDVDLGLFLLGKLFENTLKGFMQLAETLGAYAILPSNYSKLQNMIDWTKSQQIIKDSAALHLLRQQRNDRAHGQALSPEERQIMFNSAGWIASIYLDYILLFSEKRQELLTSNRSGAITNE